MIDFRAICVALAARYAPGTISTPTGASAMRASYAQAPKNVPTVPCVVLEIQQGTVTANPGQWKHEMQVDAIFVLSKRPGDPARVDTQRQLWLPALLAATEGKLTLGLAGQAGYSVDKAIPTGWDWIEYQIGADGYDGIRISYTIFVTENVSLVP
jgi:hypothetical protein